MSVSMPTLLDELCPSMRYVAQRGQREPRAPLDNLGMALHSLEGFFVAEATGGTPAPTIVAIIDHLVENQARFKALRGVVFYTLPELRHAIHRREPLPIYFTGIDMLTLRFVPCKRTAEEFTSMLMWWNLSVDWSGKTADPAKIWLDSITAPD